MNGSCMPWRFERREQSKQWIFWIVPAAAIIISAVRQLALVQLALGPRLASRRLAQPPQPGAARSD
jgi:hypothetical protein